jgi:hypoxanthine phosphoribosyltransferase
VLTIDGKPLQPLLTEEQLQTRIKELGAEITEDYKDKDLLVIGVLRGSFMFMADLVREIKLPCPLDFLGLSSYGNRTESSGVVQITSDLSMPIKDKDVLVVEDIIDTGLTMNYLHENLMTRRPKSLRVCSLLEKPSRNIQPVEINYLGFTIDNHFVIGYGLDYQGAYRNLPYIGMVQDLSKES